MIPFGFKETYPGFGLVRGGLKGFEPEPQHAVGGAVGNKKEAGGFDVFFRPDSDLGYGQLGGGGGPEAGNSVSARGFGEVEIDLLVMVPDCVGD